MSFSKEQIDALRTRVRESMSDFRFNHTAEVEKMAVRLGELYAPHKEDILRVAALLHDVTKEKKTAEQLKLLEDYGCPAEELERMSPKTLHAKTASLLISKDEDYKAFAIPEVVEAVKRHTVGGADMSICDMIIYLADYIDMSRTFDDCVTVRNYFWDRQPEKMRKTERYEHLLKTLVLSFDLTIKALIDEGSPISPETLGARNRFICILNNI